MSLAEELESLEWSAAELLAGTEDPSLTLDELADVTLEAQAKLRALAITQLLVQADSDAFLHNLIRAGLLWARYLGRCHSEGARDAHDYGAGRFEPLIDAIAAADFPLGASIVALTPSRFHVGHEHEADFAYARMLDSLIAPDQVMDDLKTLAGRCAEAGDEMSSARADVCLAISRRDSTLFDDSFRGFLARRRAEIAAAIARNQVEDEVVLACRSLSVEGVALLNLAARHGIDLEREYPDCPSLARRPMRRRFVPI